MTAIQAPDRLAGSLVVGLPKFRLLPGEPLGAGLRRLGIEAIDEAISGFYDGEEVFGEAVHDARKAMKRIRALLRLVRYEIGERVYRFENVWMRDTARLISAVRGAAVLVETTTNVRDLYRPVLADGTFDEMEERLSVRRDRIEQKAMEDPELIPGVVGDLERARLRYESWPTDPDAHSAYGMGVRQGYAAVGPGLRATHARGRKEMVAAYQTQTPEAFHRWRKRARYLRHQMEILTPVWPEVMIGMAITLDRISGLLGEDHDLVELLRVLSDRPDICPNPLERSLMAALAEQRRSDLQTASRILGRRIYAEAPAALEERLSGYWEAMEEMNGTRLLSVPA